MSIVMVWRLVLVTRSRITNETYAVLSCRPQCSRQGDMARRGSSPRPGAPSLTSSEPGRVGTARPLGGTETLPLPLARGEWRAAAILGSVPCVWRDFCDGTEMSRLPASANAEVLLLRIVGSRNG
jgi:hypothetical protein